MKTQLGEDIKAAMKAGEKVVLTTLRGLQAEIKKFEIDSREEADEAKCIALVKKEIKKRRDALEFAEKAGREDLIEQNTAEITLLERYLPEQMSEEQLRAKIKSYIDAGADSLGAVMGKLNAEHKGLFDGKQASQIAKELTS